MQQTVQQAGKATAKPDVTGVNPADTGEKKSKLWLWILIAVIVIGAGVGIYYWLA